MTRKIVDSRLKAKGFHLRWTKKVECIWFTKVFHSPKKALHSIAHTGDACTKNHWTAKPELLISWTKIGEFQIKIFIFRSIPNFRNFPNSFKIMCGEHSHPLITERRKPGEFKALMARNFVSSQIKAVRKDSWRNKIKLNIKWIFWDFYNFFQFIQTYSDFFLIWMIFVVSRNSCLKLKVTT